MSSYYGSPPGSIRSSVASCAPRASSYFPSPIQEQSVYAESRSSYGTLSPTSSEHTVLAPPTPLKVAHTIPSLPSLKNTGGHLQPSAPTGNFAHSGNYGGDSRYPSAPSPTFTPNGYYAPSPYGNAPSPSPEPVPFVEHRSPSPRRYNDETVNNTLSYSDKIVHSPEPVTIRNRQQSPLPGIRALTPLPESFEIALPPGVQLRPDTPDEILFHPSDERPRVGTPRAGTPVGGMPINRVGTPVDQMLFPIDDRPQTPQKHAPPRGESSTPQSAFRGSPAPTVADSITAYGFNQYRASPVPSQATTMVNPDSYPGSIPEKQRYDPQMPIASSPYELNGLWNAAQGAHPMNGDGKIYILSNFRQTPLSPDPISFPEHFTFGPSLKSPFYMLHAMPSPLHSHNTHNELSLRRKNPASGDMQSLARMSLPLSGLPDADGLVTLIYPKRAVVAAMTSSQVALPQTHKTRAAVDLVAESECCRLTWSPKNRRYELSHPAMSSRNIHEQAALVVKIEGGAVGFDNLGAKGSIKLINTINQDTLAALDFGRSLLFINTGATMKIPSRHIVDVAVGTLLAVATMEGRRARNHRAATPSIRPSMRSYHTSHGAAMKVETVGTVEEAREARETNKTKRGCPGPGMVVVKIAKGAWLLVYFTGKLGYEIVKAIVDAFRPLPSEQSGRNGRGYEKQRSAQGHHR